MVEWITRGWELSWDPDGFNLSGATPSVTGGALSRGSLDRGRFLWHTPCQTLKKKRGIYAEKDEKDFKNAQHTGPFLRQYFVWGPMRESGVGGKRTKYLFIFSTSLCFIPLGSGC